MSGRNARRVKGRTELLARLPRALRPQISSSQLTNLGICHIQNVDAIATGKADIPLLWDWIETTLTWLEASKLMQAGRPEMLEQFDLVIAVVERHEKTKRIVFTGPEYQLAKKGVDVMDELAKITDLANFALACRWATAKTNQLKAASEARELAAA